MTEVFAWLALLILLVLIELATMGLTTIWFAAGALVCDDCSCLWCAGSGAGHPVFGSVRADACFYKTGCHALFQCWKGEDQCGQHAWGTRYRDRQD